MNILDHEDDPKTTKRGKQRERHRVNYYVPPFGNMCRDAFLLLWGKSEHALRNLKIYQKENPGYFAPRIHGNTFKLSCRLQSSGIREAVIDFIKEIGVQVGEESEGRHTKKNNQSIKNGTVRFLPTFYSVALLYRLFLAHYKKLNNPAIGNFPPLSLRQFYYIFRSSDCECVQIRSPRSDVCDICLLYRNKIRRDNGIVNEKDEEQITEWNKHVLRAKETRKVYRDEIASAQRGYLKLISDISNQKLLEDYVPHITFDFAQNLGLPQIVDQPQDLYFVSQRWLQLFSIRDDGAGIQYNYLYDEGDGGKGGNYVASMLVGFLLDFAKQFKVKQMLMNADNCCSQNKNNIILWTLELLVILGIFDHIELKFLVNGHTHCSVDGGHGLIKKKWRKSDVFSIQQAKELVENCSTTQRAIIITTRDFYDWSSLLSPYFRKLPGLSLQQEFEFNRNRLGVVRYRNSHADQWQSYTLISNEKLGIPEDIASLKAIKARLKELKPPGIPIEKQWNLYKKVSKYVPDEFKSNLCPKPNEMAICS
jgi:hypothetical protein